MRVLMISENDPAGTGILFCKAVNQLLGRRCCRLVTTQTRYNHLFEKDLHVPWLDADGLAELDELLRTSDIFHFHLIHDEDIPLGPFTPSAYLKGKTLVHHHHGHPDFRGNPEKYRKKYRDLGRRNLLVSTPDLLQLLPEAMWQPNLVPIHDPLYLPHPEPAEGPIRIGHSPTRKDLKNTDDLQTVVAQLQKKLPAPGVELELIDDAPHVECLRRKQHCHIVFDHMQGYYGMSSLEALSQGKPTIAGLNAWCARRIQELFQCDALPWVRARNTEELTMRLRELSLDAAMRRETGASSRRFMEEYWTDERVAAFLVRFWESL